MRIATPSVDDRGLESEVSMHFGHAQYYTFVDVEDEEIKMWKLSQFHLKTIAPAIYRISLRRMAEIW